MILTYDAGPQPQYDRYLDQLARQSSFEETPSGLVYSVADALPAEITVLGKVNSTEEMIDVDLFVSAEIDPKLRSQVAEICFSTQEWVGRYAVANAGDRVVEGNDQAVNQALFDVLATNLRAHRDGIQAMDRRKEFIHPLTRAQLRSTIGWVATRRPIGEQGLELMDTMEKYEIMVPMVDEGSLLLISRHPKTNGMTVEVKGMIEKSERHHCKCCSGQILQNSTRITASQDRKIGGYDHHHFHPVCFLEKELPGYDLKTGLILPPQ